MITIRSFSAAIDEAVLDAEAAAAASAASSSASAASAAEVEALIADAATGYLSFATISDLEAFTPSTSDPVTASVAEDENFYRWDDGGSAWVLVGPNPSQQIATVVSAFDPEAPGAPDDGTLWLVNEDDYVLMVINPADLATLMQNATWLSETPEYLPLEPTGGNWWAVNADDYVITNFSSPVASEDTAEDDTADHVAYALKDSVGDHEPLLVGKNTFLTVGESKANTISYMSEVFDMICTQMGTPKPSGATVADAVWFHNAYKASDLIADWSTGKADIDAAFTAGAECISMIQFVEMANDMGASGAINSADTWERDILTLKTMVQRYCLQKYVGTDPAAIPPVPPAFIVQDCTWPLGQAGSLSTDIPLRAVEMSHRIWDFGVAMPDYICAFSDDRHYLDSVERNRVSAYFAVADYWWRILKRKYHPTQVIDAWFDGSDAFLRVQMPHGPLVADTALVASIMDNGLECFTAAGATIAITALDIVGGGQIVKITQAGSWAAGDRIQGGITGTTANKSGRTDGPRLMYRDSSPYVADLGGGDEPLYSPMLPFIRYLKG